MKLLFRFRMMMSLMFRFTRKILEILYSIIILYPINVVDAFCRKKIATDMFFHNKTMFSNVSSSHSKWMTFKKNKNISIPIKCLSIFPMSVSFSTLRYASLSNMFSREFLIFPISNLTNVRFTNFLTGFFREFLTIHPFTISTLFSNIRFMNICTWFGASLVYTNPARVFLKRILTNCTNYFYHILILQLEMVEVKQKGIICL